MARERRRSREAVVEDLDLAGRVLSTAAVMFHTALAEKQGLSASDGKALDLLDRFGPLTAGDLAARSGLAPASVTGLVDRLEHKGFVRRVPDPSDGRRVVVEIDRARVYAMAPVFDDFVGALHAMYEGYTVEQLETVLRFLGDAARVQREATTRLGQTVQAAPRPARSKRRRPS